MKRVLLFFCLWVACTAVGRSQRLVAVGKGYSCTSVNTAVFRNNSFCLLYTSDAADEL